MRRAATIRLLLLAFASVLASRASAQDIEMAAAIRGRTLPQAYHDRVRLRPDFFSLRDGWRRRLAAATTQGVAVTGILPIAVIPARFADTGPRPPHLDRDVLQEYLFDGAPTSTVRGFFDEVSLGKLDMRGRVLEWTGTSLTRAQVVGASYGLGGDARTDEWLRQAIATADPTVNFGEFDNDGPDGIPNSGDDDGVVDGAAFLFQEVDAACGGPGIWPHRARLSGWGGGPAVTDDLRPNGQRVLINDYIALGAGDCSGTRALGANTFAHEMGHVLGLPDYYDARLGIERHLRRWVIGCWELMSAGAWGCGTGPQPPTLKPPHFGAYTKVLLGWISPRLVSPDALRLEVTLPPVRTTGEVLRVPMSPDEFLLVEYRDGGGFDSMLPQSGVAIYHVQTGRSWLPCASCAPTYSYALKEADGNSRLTLTEAESGNRGEAGDLFGGAARRLDASSLPGTRLNGGAMSTVTIHSVTVDVAAAVASLRISTSATPTLVSPPASVAASVLVPIDIAIPVGGGAMPYALQVSGSPAGLSIVVDGDVVRITGTPLVAGARTVSLGVRDARSVTTSYSLLVTVSGPTFTVERLLAALPGGASPLSASERDYLDQQGNRNGRFDLGDVRAYLRHAAASVAP